MRTSEKVVGCCGFCSLSLCFVNILTINQECVRLKLYWCEKKKKETCCQSRQIFVRSYRARCDYRSRR